MVAIFESILPIFALVLLGFGLRRGGLILAEQWRTIEDLCFWVLFPAILIKVLATADFSQLQLGPPLFAVLCFTGVMGMFALGLWPILKSTFGTGKAQYSSVYQTITRWNGFVALIIALRLFGDESAALMAVILALMTIILQVSNLLVLAAFTPGKRPTLLAIVMMIAKNPIIIGLVVGVGVNLSGVTLWRPVLDSLDLLGRAALGTSLLTIGAGLLLAAALKPSTNVVVAVVGKLIISPLVMLAIALWFGVSGLTLSILVLCATVPTSMNGYIVTKKMGGDAELYASAVTLQTLGSFVTIPVFLVLASKFGGVF